MRDFEQMQEPTPTELGVVLQPAANMLAVTCPTEPGQHAGGPSRDKASPDATVLTAQALPGAPPIRALPATLERLPGELQIQILSCLDLNDLRAAVHASPVLQQYYVLDRRRLLEHALRSTLGSTLVDAYAVREATCFAERHKELQQQHRVDRDIESILGKYVDHRADVDGVLEQCNVEALIDMASFYLAVVQPLLLQCSAMILQNLKHPPELGILTKTERIRFLRALYRFQVFQKLFGQRGRLDSRFTQVEMLAEFFGIFQPWEIDEVNCIDRLVRAKYNGAFKGIGRIVYTRDRKITSQKGFSDLKDASPRHLLVDNAPAYGLEPFLTALKTRGHANLVQLTQQHVCWFRGGALSTIPNCLRPSIQFHRRLQFPSVADREEADRVELPFSGDKEDGPPLAWVTMWNGTVSNTYGSEIPAAVQDWGYVFWDAQRLVEMGGEQEVKKAWASRWPRHDPRYG